MYFPPSPYPPVLSKLTKVASCTAFQIQHEFYRLGTESLQKSYRQLRHPMEVQIKDAPRLTAANQVRKGGIASLNPSMSMSWWKGYQSLQQGQTRCLAGGCQNVLGQWAPPAPTVGKSLPFGKGMFGFRSYKMNCSFGSIAAPDTSKKFGFLYN